jgi:hypothetical protein
MKKVSKYLEIRENYEAIDEAINDTGEFYFHPPLVIEYKGKKYITSAGYSDHVTIFADAEEICILCQNSRHGYCGAQFLDLNTGKETASIFLEGNDIEDKTVLSYKLDRIDPRKAFNIIGQYYIN